MATRNPVWWFEQMTMRELFCWLRVIADEMERAREELESIGDN